MKSTAAAVTTGRIKRVPRLLPAMLPLQAGEPLPIAATGAAVLLVSLLVTALWLLYLGR